MIFRRWYYLLLSSSSYKFWSQSGMSLTWMSTTSRLAFTTTAALAALTTWTHRPWSTSSPKASMRLATVISSCQGSSLSQVTASRACLSNSATASIRTRAAWRSSSTTLNPTVLWSAYGAKPTLSVAASRGTHRRQMMRGLATTWARCASSAWWASCPRCTIQRDSAVTASLIVSTISTQSRWTFGIHQRSLFLTMLLNIKVITYKLLNKNKDRINCHFCTFKSRKQRSYIELLPCTFFLLSNFIISIENVES